MPSIMELRAFVEECPLGVVATVGADGGPQAALVGLAATANGDLVFNASDASRKIENLTRNGRVAVVVGGVGDVTMQVEGDAVVESGAGRDEAARVYEARFPGSRVSADGFAVVRVRPRWIRVYDVRTDPPTVTESGHEAGFR